MSSANPVQTASIQRRRFATSQGLQVGGANVCTPEPAVDAAVPGLDAAPIDANNTPDAATTAYEVAYGNVFTFITPELVVNDWLLVINTGGIPLDMNTIEVRSVADDHPTANITVLANPHVASVPPGFAGGHLSPAYEDPVINSGLVPEPRTDFEGGGANAVLRMFLESAGNPGGTYDIRVDVTIAINDVEKDLSILIHVDATEFHTATGFIRE